MTAPGVAWEARVDLRGLGYHLRRRRVLTALRGLTPGGVVHLVSDRADDVLWLRYEVEERVAERYAWSLPTEGRGPATTMVRRSPNPAAPRRCPGAAPEIEVRGRPRPRTAADPAPE